MDLAIEFDRQVKNLVQKDYPELAGISEEEFINKVSLLKQKLQSIELKEIDLENGYLPFVIVVKGSFASTSDAMGKVNKDGKVGVTKLFPHEPRDFQVIKEEKIPEGDIYLLIDIDRGKDTLNVRPEDALKTTRKKGRFPLTIDEGVAIVTQYPEFLIKNNCFSLLASRHPGDQRVPAIWINASKQPNLGWCWDRNPHTWLGSASGGKRVG